MERVHSNPRLRLEECRIVVDVHASAVDASTAPALTGYADEAALREFEHSWSRLLHKVRAARFDLAVYRPALGHWIPP